MKRTRKITDAIYAHCPECDAWWSNLDPVPWGLSQTRAMHERGTGHKLVLFAADDDA